MGKKTNFFIITVVIAVLAAGAVYLYIMNAGGRNLASEDTDFTVSSKEIIAEFANNEDAANKKYLPETVAVVIKGTVTKVEGVQVTIDNNVICGFTEADPSVKVGEMISVKGRVSGYDDLMEELKLVQCFKE